MTKEELLPHVERGETIRGIAKSFNLTHTTIFYWIKKHGIATNNKRGPRNKTASSPCINHPNTSRVLSSNGSYVCPACRYEKLKGKRHRAKQALVSARGGRCERCGYSKYTEVMEFHHIDPSQKDFQLSSRMSFAFDAIIKEAEKCMMLCPTCHREVHIELKTDSAEVTQW